MGNWLRRKLGHNPDINAAEQGLARADQQHAAATRRWPEIRELSRDLEALRMENNFAARIRAAYGESR